MQGLFRKLTYPVRRWPRLTKAAMAGGVGLTVLVVLANAYILLSTEGEATANLADVPPAEAAIVPGALVQPNGKMSAMLADRVRQASALWRAGKVKRILVSGDHHTWAYDEPDTMRKALVEEDVAAGHLRGPRRLRHLGDDGQGSRHLRRAQRCGRYAGLPHATSPLPRRCGRDRRDRPHR
jgi:hypothetical protein